MKLKFRVLAVVPILVCFLCFFSGCNGGSGGSESDVSYLYVQNADTGTLTDTGNGFFVLMLSGVAPNTNYFSDREKGATPQAGVMGTDEFITDWSNPDDPNNFKIDPPVAALDVYDANGELSSVAIQLMTPLYDAAQATLEYRVKLVDTFPARLQGREMSANFPASFQRVSLFIDDSTSVTSDKAACGDRLELDVLETISEEIYTQETLATLNLLTMSETAACKNLLPTQADRQALADYIWNNIADPYPGLTDECQPHGTCGQFSQGNSFIDCVNNCQDAGCDYNTATNIQSCWCVDWCFENALPYPSGS